MPVGLGPLQDPVGTNMGNPHATFFVDDARRRSRSPSWGRKLEHDRFFPERANIGVAQMVGEDRLRLRVWERGAGLTLACGSGACAAVVAASRRGLVEAQGRGGLEHGTLTIEWLRDGHVMMTGGIALAFKGELDRPRWPHERTAEGGSWLSRLRGGLSKSTKRVTESITGLFTKKKLDQADAGRTGGRADPGRSRRQPSRPAWSRSSARSASARK